MAESLPEVEKKLDTIASLLDLYKSESKAVADLGPWVACKSYAELLINADTFVKYRTLEQLFARHKDLQAAFRSLFHARYPALFAGKPVAGDGSRYLDLVCDKVYEEVPWGSIPASVLPASRPSERSLSRSRAASRSRGGLGTIGREAGLRGLSRSPTRRPARTVTTPPAASPEKTEKDAGGKPSGTVVLQPGVSISDGSPFRRPTITLTDTAPVTTGQSKDDAPPSAKASTTAGLRPRRKSVQSSSLSASHGSPRGRSGRKQAGTPARSTGRLQDIAQSIAKALAKPGPQPNLAYVLEPGLGVGPDSPTRSSGKSKTATAAQPTGQSQDTVLPTADASTTAEQQPSWISVPEPSLAVDQDSPVRPSARALSTSIVARTGHVRNPKPPVAGDNQDGQTYAAASDQAAHRESQVHTPPDLAAQQDGQQYTVQVEEVDDDSQVHSPLDETATSSPGPDEGLTSSFSKSFAINAFNSITGLDVGKKLDAMKAKYQEWHDASVLDDDVVVNVTDDGFGSLLLPPEQRAAAYKDVRMHPYKDTVVHSPKIMLNRICNFLSDERPDKTLNWREKAVEIAEYLQHLATIFDGHHWQADFRRAVDLLRAFWLLDQFQRGIVDPSFNNVIVMAKPESRLRLPFQLRSTARIIRNDAARNRALRYTTPRPPESVQDAQWTVPPKVLFHRFLPWLRHDGRVLWSLPMEELASLASDGDDISQGWNLAMIEDQSYVACLSVSTTDRLSSTGLLARRLCLTAHALVTLRVERIEAAVKERRRAYEASDAHHALFAQFRGTKRAALQLAVNHVRGDVNSLVAGERRSLILPLRRSAPNGRVAVAVVRPTIDYDPAVHEDDPFLCTALYLEYARNQAAAASKFASRPRTDAAADAWASRPLTLSNWTGPSQHDPRSPAQADAYRRLRRMMGIAAQLECAQERAPRRLLETVIGAIEHGLNGTGLPHALLQTIRPYGYGRTLDALLTPLEESWIRLPTGRSSSAKAQGAVPALCARDKILLDRVQALVDDLSPISPFRSVDAVVDLPHFVELINRSRNGPVRAVVFSPDEISKLCETFEMCGIISYSITEDGKEAFSRPQSDIHPEHRIVWSSPVSDNPATMLASSLLPATVQDPDSAPPDGAADDDRTTAMYIWLAYRLGRTISDLQARLAPESDLGPAASHPGTDDADSVGLWSDDVDMPDEQVDKADEAEPGLLPARPTSLVDIACSVNLDGVVEAIKAAFGGAARRAAATTAARDIVRGALVLECCENYNPLWPSRRPLTCTPDQRGPAETTRGPVWGWAAGVAPTPRPVFSMDKWPPTIPASVFRPPGWRIGDDPVQPLAHLGPQPSKPGRVPSRKRAACASDPAAPRPRQRRRVASQRSVRREPQPAARREDDMPLPNQESIVLNDVLVPVEEYTPKTFTDRRASRHA